MDYVREELLRQNRVLEALMRSGAEREQEPEQEDPEMPSQAAVRLRKEAASVWMKEAGGEARLPKSVFPAVAERKRPVLWGEFAQETGERRAAAERAVSVLRRGESVREVSRAIERDARRYDGGFTMY